MSELYENLLKATNNVDDITTEKYAIITTINGNYCSVKETDTDMEHSNIPIVNGANLSVGDKVIIGFLNNSIYDVVCYGALDKQVQMTPTPHNHGNLNNDGTITTTENGNFLYFAGIGSTSNKLFKANHLKATQLVDTSAHSNIGSSSNDNQATINSDIDAALSGKQSTLISGTNIKTVNNESLLGSGNITIQGGGSSVDIVTSWESTPSDSKVASEKLVKDSLDAKQDTLTSGSNIKTVNSTSLLGSGDISIPKGDDGSLFWTTTTAPTTPNYTFTIANLTGETGKTPKKGDIIFYSYYRYTVDTVGETTLKATPRQSIRGSTGAAGSTGATGNGISSISKTGTSGLVDTYTITYTNTDTDTFTVTNGSDATVTIVDNLNSDSSTSVLSAKQGKVLNTNKIETSAIATSFGSTTSDSKVPSEKLVKTELDKKIATSSTTGLVKNDGTIDTNSYLTSSSLSNYVQKSSTSGLLKNDGTVDTNSYITSSSLPTKTSDLTNDGSSSSDSLVYVETSATSGLLKNDGTVDTNSYSTTSHSHNQITSDGKITSTAVTVASGDNIVITDASDSSKIKRVANLLTDHVKDSSAHSNIGSSANDTQSTINSSIDTALSNKISTSQTTGLVKNDGSIDTSSYITSSAISGKEDTSNKVTSWSSTTTDAHYPSEKLTKDSLDGKSDSTHKHGNLNNDGTVTTAETGNFIYFCGIGSTSNKLFKANHLKATQLIDTNAHTNIGSSANDSQATINTSIDTALSGKASSSHTHGNLSNDGKIGSSSDKIIVTGTDGVLQATDTITKSKISDFAHTHTSSDVTDLIDTIYPIGAVYISTNSTSPQTLFGGTWVQIKDTFLLACGDTYSNGATGGSADAVIVEHTHTQEEHRHEQIGSKSGGLSSGNYLRAGYGSAKDSKYTDYETPTINSTGESGTGKNMPPYLAVYVWERTA